MRPTFDPGTPPPDIEYDEPATTSEERLRRTEERLRRTEERLRRTEERVEQIRAAMAAGTYRAYPTLGLRATTASLQKLREAIRRELQPRTD